ncbi:Tat pathway signal sequence domain protein [Streptomyces sp. NK08204]|uniref:Tat pathway signal sequence domain protein n=1 Tax=Streptomyces sp. NK08204 TaxID=2873260 RepID=UPI001CED96A8|nr:Tat pathway signal sequence domain protein [Streptomyces sp. NK08204]
MSGIGPLEPGEGTHEREAGWAQGRASAAGAAARTAGRTPGVLRALYARHRRATVAVAAGAVLLAGGGTLYATRPQQPPPPEPPYPAQVVEVTYLHGAATPAGAPPRSFSFTLLLTVESGPPVTVTRVTQPYAGLSLTTDPRTPFETQVDSARKITITMHVTECGKVPKDAGLPFLEVTLRNARAIQIHSFIPGSRYAQHLSRALKVSCSNISASSPKPSRRLNGPG